jgi:hypothetical protein
MLAQQGMEPATGETSMRAVSGLIVAALLAISPSGSADEADGAAAAEIRSVIESQLAAFRVDDGPAAFAYASPGIQAQFQTPEIFMEMVRTGYAPVYRPQAVEFLDLMQAARGPVQPVHIVGPDGRAVIALYTMERQPDGSWRIDGCTLTEAPDVGA